MKLKQTLASLVLAGACIFGANDAKADTIKNESVVSESALDVIPHNYTHEWFYNPNTEHYYRLSDPGYWSDTLGESLNDGGYLTAIGSAEENQWIMENIGSINTGFYNILWIGFTDEVQEGNWQWSNGEPVTYTNWHGGEPNNVPTYYGSDEDYGSIYNRFIDWRVPGMWNDSGNFEDIYPGIIERNTNPYETIVPEPATLSLLGIGLAGLGANALKKRSKL